MAGIFTRNALNRIMADENLTPEQRTEQVYSLYGRALDDGYVSKSAAQQAQEAAVEAARTDFEKNHQAPDVKQSEDYLKLQGDYDAYREMQKARSSAEFASVKPKFFETVYGLVDRGDGADPVDKQLAGIREKYEEYFTPAESEPSRKPAFGAPLEGGMPKGATGAVKGFSDAWGFGPNKSKG